MDEDEEEYIFFGTPLPDLEDEATLKKKAAKELQVRDEKGRQRFHGAFTGGFAAGYFNTVGTKEGWAPSTFVSTRSQVADRFQQNPEDFMDDEDFGEFGIATRRIHTTSNFQDGSDVNLRKRKYISTDSVIPGEAPLKDIVQPVRKSIGIQILEKLGWRLGQGIGPRIKKQTTDIKVYGCSPFPDAVLPEEDDSMALAFTYAPKDTEATFYQPKDNYFGLGYTGLSKESVLGARTDPFAPTSTKSWLTKDKKKLSISGQAFGVGAFEDDDEDIYGKDDMSQYDFSDLTPKGALNTHEAIEAQKDGISDGIIVGFCLSSEPPTVKKHYPAPALPPNFQPIHLKLKLACQRASNATPDKSRHALSASDRSLILGEKRFQKLLPKETNFCTEKINNLDLLYASSSASTVSLNFRPFSNDALKQQRYEEYLKLKKEGDVGKLVQPSSMTEWEKQQEIEEFAKAGVLFKPLSSALSSRFESKSHLSVEHEVMAELEKIKKEKELKQTSDIKRNLIGSSNRKTFEWHPASLLCKRMNVPNPYPNYNSSGTQSIHKTKSVFDHLSLTSEKSHSHKEATLSSGSHNSVFESKTNEDMLNEISQPVIQVLSTPIISGNELDQSTENKRPSMDLFKDIFENSSSEEEDAIIDEKSKISNKPMNSEKEIILVNDNIQEKPSVSLQNRIGFENTVKFSQSYSSENSASVNLEMKSKKIGFGVFANLDLDALNQRKPIDRPEQKILNSGNDATNNNLITNKNHNDLPDELPSASMDAYGPELPPNFSCTSASNTCISESSSFSLESKKLVKHKSKHKHKHHKHKSKKSKKKSSKRYSDESDSSEEFEDVPPEVIIEKLKKLQKRKR